MADNRTLIKQVFYTSLAVGLNFYLPMLPEGAVKLVVGSVVALGKGFGSQTSDVAKEKIVESIEEFISLINPFD